MILYIHSKIVTGVFLHVYIAEKPWPHVAKYTAETKQAKRRGELTVTRSKQFGGSNYLI